MRNSNGRIIFHDHELPQVSIEIDLTETFVGRRVCALVALLLQHSLHYASKVTKTPFSINPLSW